MSEALDDFYPKGGDPWLAGIAAGRAAPVLEKGFASIDPGYSGAIGLIDRAGRRVLSLVDTPVVRDGKHVTYDILGMFAVAERLAELAEVVFIERQQPMIGKETSGEQVGFAIGFGYGVWTAVLTVARKARSLPPEWLVEVAPITWKTRAGVMPPRPAKGALAKLTKIEKRKRTAKNREESARKTIELAASLYENMDFFDLKRTTESEKASPDRAVALVLAHVGRRMHLGLG